MEETENTIDTTPPIIGCIDVVLPPELEEEARALAIEENPANAEGGDAAPADARGPLDFLATETSKLWKPGRVLRVYFMNGSEFLRGKVRAFALEWCRWANIDIQFSSDPASEIRVNFDASGGSWSAMGTDCLSSYYKGRQTMNFGWFKETTKDDEFSRTVCHEFGHALGCIHEHQNPAGGISWNTAKVYEVYGGPPNNWDKDKIDAQIFKKYSADITQFSALDAKSIMMYPFSSECTTNGFSSPLNCYLTDMDKIFIAQRYPRITELDIKPTKSLVLAADDHGSGADRDVRTFVPSLESGYYHLGHHGQGNYGAADGTTIMVKDLTADKSALKPPTGATMIWSDKGSGKSDDYSVWRPIAPAGYVALGDVFKHGHDYNPPNLDTYRCVKASLVTAATLDPSLVWCDKGSGANADVTLYRIVPPANGGCVPANLFYAQPNYDAPSASAKVYCLAAGLRK